MKWNEMTTVRKVLTVVEFLSGILFWTLFLLNSLDILKSNLATYVLLLVNGACHIFTANNKVFRILWIVVVVVMCILPFVLF